MKTSNLIVRAIAMGLMLAVCALPQQPPAHAGVKVLSRDAIDQLLVRPGRTFWLDVRDAEEIAKIGGFAGYVNIPIAELEKRLAEVPKDKPIVTISNHADRASRAAELLAKRGYKVLGAAGAQSYESQGGKLHHFAPENR